MISASDAPGSYFLPLSAKVARVVNEQGGLEVTDVVPVKRIPKTTSGKIQRYLLEQSYLDGEFEAELAKLAALRAAERKSASLAPSAIEDQLRQVVSATLEGKQIDLDDNLFEIGASSLQLIEIHEQIERQYPGLLELAELTEYPTISALARRLETKLSARMTLARRGG